MKLSTSLLLLGVLLTLALGANQVHHLWVMLLGVSGLLLLEAGRRGVRAYRQTAATSRPTALATHRIRAS